MKGSWALVAKMERLQERRGAVIALHRSGKSTGAILNLLSSEGASRRFINRTINRYVETGGIRDRPRSGRPRSKRTPKLKKAVRMRLMRNPARSANSMAQELKVSRGTLQKLISKDLKIRPFKKYKAHYLTLDMQKKRLQRCKLLLQRYANQDVEKILFTDEKLFLIEPPLNSQNDRVYAANRRAIPEHLFRVERSHHPAGVMVFLGVSTKGCTELVFVPKGVKICAANYISDVLEPYVLPMNWEQLGEEEWIYQQDSAPAHKFKITQAWLKEHVPAFISHSEWPPNSPDLNPLDYFVWSKLLSMLGGVRYKNIADLKRALVKAWSKFPQHELRAAILQWRTRLKACVKAKGGHIEHHLNQ